MNKQSADMAALTWRKSSYSSGNGQCVEVARCGNGTAVRDSKNPGVVVWFGRVEFGMVTGLRS